MNAILEKNYKTFVADMPQEHDPAIEDKIFGRFLPYEALSKEHIRIYSLFFPEQSKFENYKEVIPETAMTLAKEITEMPDYNKVCPEKLGHGEKSYSFGMVVWSKPSKIKDPILMVKKCEYEGVHYSTGQYVSTTESYHLIAQWGESLPTYEEIRNFLFLEAKKRVESFGKRMKVFSLLALEDSDGYAEKLLAGEDTDFENEVKALKEGYGGFSTF